LNCPRLKSLNHHVALKTHKSRDDGAYVCTIIVR